MRLRGRGCSTPRARPLILTSAAGRRTATTASSPGGFIVHFFGRELVERLAAGYELLEVREFEEGDLPRRLFAVVQQKPVVTGTG